MLSIFSVIHPNVESGSSSFHTFGILYDVLMLVAFDARLFVMLYVLFFSVHVNLYVASVVSLIDTELSPLSTFSGTDSFPVISMSDAPESHS